MKILQINASYKPAYIYGGPTMSVSKLCEELVKAGQDIEVFTTSANGETELDLKPGCTKIVERVRVTYFRRLTKDPSHFSPALLYFLWKTLRTSSGQNSQHKIVHIHAWWNLVSVGACAIALLLSKPVILSPRGTLSSYSFGNRKSFFKKIFHQAVGKTLLTNCHFHVSTEKEKQDISNLLKPISITVIPNFVDLEKSAETTIECNKQDDTFKLLFLSRIEEKKGLDILINALAGVHSKWQLTIAGTGNLDYVSKLKELACELKLNGKINWIGQQDREQKFRILTNHDLMILPSYDESFANVVIESLSVGTAVLVSKNVGLSNYVSSWNLGWVYDMTSNLGSTIDDALLNNAKMKSIRLNGPVYITRDFNDCNILKQYLKFYQNLDKITEFTLMSKE